MTQATINIALAVKDRETRKALIRAVKTMDGLAPATQAGAADILVYEVERGMEQDYMRKRQTLAAQVNGEVFLVCSNPNPKFLIQAMRSGVQEVLPAPLNRKEFAQAVARYRERISMNAEAVAAPGKGRVIGVLGARPGVGATTLAVNLAVELQRTGPTSLMDMAVPLGEVPLFLDLEYSYTWSDVVQNISRLDATYLKGVMVRHASGLSLLASPGDSYLPPDAGKAMPAIVEELRKSFAHTVIDTDALLSPSGLKELDKVDEVVLVMNLSLPCLAHVQRLSEVLRRLESTGITIRVAVNRYIKDSDILPAEAEDILGRKINWLIPEDGPAVLSAINQGCPLAEVAPKSPVTKAVKNMARTLTGPGNQPASKGFGSLFSRKSETRQAPQRTLTSAEAV